MPPGVKWQSTSPFHARCCQSRSARHRCEVQRHRRRRVSYATKSLRLQDADDYDSESLPIGISATSDSSLGEGEVQYSRRILTRLWQQPQTRRNGQSNTCTRLPCHAPRADGRGCRFSS